MRKLFLLALAVLTSGLLFAQSRITGKVSSAEDGSAVSFASIVVKGTQMIATSDDNGEYALDNVPNDAVLVFSSIGETKFFPLYLPPTILIISPILFHLIYAL